MGRSIFLIFASLGLLCGLLPGTSQALDACGTVTLAAVPKGTLPISMYNARVAWDGLLNIYIFGGQDANGVKLNSIYSYSLVTSTVTKLSQTLPSARYSGVVVRDWLTPNVLPSFYYMGVDDTNSTTDPIYKFNPLGGAVTEIGRIQTVTEGLAAAETTNHHAYIFGGPYYPWANVSSFDMTSGAVTIVGNLVRGLPSVGTAVYYAPTGNITIVGAAVAGSYRDTRVMSFDPNSIGSPDGHVSDLAGTIEDLPELDHASAAVDSDENNMWVIGGYQKFLPEDPSITGIYQIGLDDLAASFIPVTGFPSHDEMWLSATSATWVSTGYKIYFFGGLMRNTSLPVETKGVAQNTIWMIDLTKQYCCGKSNGLFPHPDDCTKFIQCSNQVTAIFSCPPLLKFNPLTQLCDFVINVVCTVSGILP